MLNPGTVSIGDCLERMRQISSNSCDLVYLDPPFFTGKTHSSRTRDGLKHFSFNDVWVDAEDYVEFITERLSEMRRVLKDTGSVFFHADHNNVHLARKALDEVMGRDNFVSEIIWYYKRWSNAKKGLLQLHQNILVYSKSKSFKWNMIYSNYSATTNIDQIMQKRSRDDRGKAIYSKDSQGNTLFGQEKKGVPLGDVWEIPFLNPKAKERTGYPTQKPILLLEKIIQLVTDEGDLVLDPFCGSGTTLVAASLMDRRFIGIDMSEEAVSLTNERLANPVKTESHLLRKGIDSYSNKDTWVEGHLSGFDYTRVWRNGGIDALLKQPVKGQPCFVRVQREGETLSEAAHALRKAVVNKGSVLCVLVKTTADLWLESEHSVIVLTSPAVQFASRLSERALQGAA